MKRSLLAIAITTTLGTVSANSFTGFDAQSSGMGHTGVAASSAANASYFNPALLSVYQGDVRFAMTLPSVRAYVDDSTGLIKDLSAFADEGGTIDQFETIDIERFNKAVFGDNSEPEMSEVLSDIAQNITQIQTLTTNYDDDDFDDIKAESDALSSNTELLNNKTGTASEEANNLQRVAINTRRDVLNLDRRALSAGLGGTALEIALPREGLAMGLHVRTNVSVGAQLFLERTDFAVVDDAVGDLIGLTDRADSLSASMTIVSDRNLDLVNWLGERDNINTDDPDEVEAWAEELANRANALATAQSETQNRLTELENYEGNYYNASGNGEFDLDELNEDDFNSELALVGANITEFGVTIARKFNYMDRAFSVGITPKLMNIVIFERRFNINDDFDDLSTVVEENTTTYFRPNLDIGAAKHWDDLWYGDVRAGLTLKDLIPYDLDTKTGNTLKMRPKIRIGAAHLSRWATVAADLDITENQPLRYGVASRYLGLGAEFNAYDWFKLRAGYRNNLSVSGAQAITTGIGITPWGVGVDIGAWFTPASFDDWEDMIRDAGVSAQFSMSF